MAGLFECLPMNWGLRGDLYLWKEMQEFLIGVSIPEDKLSFETIIADAFEKITVKPIDTAEPFYLKRFSHGGQSSGMIAPNYWRTKAIPFLWSQVTGQKFDWPYT